MTDEERALVMSLAKAWDDFLALPVEHDDDQREFRHGIHMLQRMVLARPARREINGYRHL
jgi:hypothetical protein